MAVTPTTPTTTNNKEAEIILPPPTYRNPIPSLSAALRLDNQEKLLECLGKQKQFLVFSSPQLRNLLLRQTLLDPHTRKFSTPHKNWDDANFFGSHPNILGTEILSKELNIVAETITYFLHSTDVEATQVLLEAISHTKSNFTMHRVVYLPQVPAMMTKLVSSTKIPRVSLQSLPLDLFPLEPDLLSMEFPHVFTDFHVEQTPSTVISDMARALLKLQDVVGTIPKLQAYGSAAEDVLRKLLNVRVEDYLSDPFDDVRSDKVSTLIFLDRKLDVCSPMLTSLTYEGLLEETFGLQHGILYVPERILHETSEKQIALAVNESDTLFSEIRHQHVEQFGSFLQTRAKALQLTKQNFSETGKDKNLTELQKFVRNLPQLQSATRTLTNHVNLAEQVKQVSEDPLFRERWQLERTMMEGDSCLDVLEELVASSYEPQRLLRLLILQSVCKNGISSSRYDSLRKDIVQTYGYEYLFLLHRLEKSGLIKRKEAFLGMDKQSSFSRLKDLMNLIDADVDTIEPTSIAYVSSGYAPLTVRLLELAVSTQWSLVREELFRELPGRFLDVQQTYPPQDLAATLKQPVNTGAVYGSLAMTDTTKPVLIVFYIGGVSIMELTALRFLSKSSSFPYQIICVTTKVLSAQEAML